MKFVGCELEEERMTSKYITWNFKNENNKISQQMH